MNMFGLVTDEARSVLCQKSGAFFTAEAHDHANPLERVDASPDVPETRMTGIFPLANAQELLDILCALSVSRDSIDSAMKYCLARSESAARIVDCIAETHLVVADAEIARLYLLSDILHNANCGFSSAWVFRPVIESWLPRIFARLFICRNVNQRDQLVVERLSSRADRVISAWRSWGIFSLEFLRGLEYMFQSGGGDGRMKLRTVAESEDSVRLQMKTHGLWYHGDGLDKSRLQQYSMDVLGMDVDIDGESLNFSDVEGLDGEELDGEELCPLEPIAESVGSKLTFSLSWKKPNSISSKHAEPVGTLNTSAVANLDSLFVQSEYGNTRRTPRRAESPPFRRRRYR